MDINVPYLGAVGNLHKILDAVQHAAVPTGFGHDFLKDLGFTSSNDRSFIKLFKYLGFLDSSGRPQSSYQAFVDHTRTKAILAERLRTAYDDLYTSNKSAHEKSAEELKGWFKSKTGKGDAVAKKMATTFKSLASYADFNAAPSVSTNTKEKKEKDEGQQETAASTQPKTRDDAQFGLVYRLEIHLPDTQNIETFRAIFRAMREELGL